MKRGYALAEALKKEAADVAREDRAALMLNAADEIERLLAAITEQRRDYDKLHTMKNQHATQNPKTPAELSCTDLLCPPFTPKEWHDISLCIGWSLAMADNSPEGNARREASRRAMDAMRRILGDQFHTRIVEAVEDQGQNRGINEPGSVK